MAFYMLCAFSTFELDLAAKGRLEDPERSGGISLLFLVRNCKQNGKEEDLRVSGVVSLLFLIKKCKEQGGEDLELSGGIALLFFKKDM